MKFVSYSRDGVPAAGVVIDQAVKPLPGGESLLDLIQEGEPALRAAGERAVQSPAALPLETVRLLPPLLPPTVRDFITFERHVEGIAAGFGDHGVAPEWYQAPAFYFTNPYAVIGAHDDVPVPPGCQAFDFELEVAAVIGRAGRDLSPALARDHILGYTIMNDWSARDLQAAEMRVHLGPAKGKDTATTLGPYLVTADELESYRDPSGFLHLTMRVEVNGKEVGRDNLANMAWTFEELTAYAARGTWVRPGDVLGSGTCGSGCLAELWGRNGMPHPPPLQVGDTVTMTVDGLGTITNTVVPGNPPVPIPPARRRTHSTRVR
jgi:2-keto-4-pentenoate hydratase/2-oxohepta-3-ene-1,7-dioic acid hydratase in catechol pathway